MTPGSGKGCKTQAPNDLPDPPEFETGMTEKKGLSDPLRKQEPISSTSGSAYAEPTSQTGETGKGRTGGEEEAVHLPEF